VKPLLGRTYLPGEDQPGRNNVLVLSYEYGGSSSMVIATLSGRRRISMAALMW
jgi:hypothetical protein